MSATLLLADDSVTVQRVIELTFADEGMDVVAVGDGRQAIARLEEVAPDIVLADVNMPERDGYEVAAHVKRHPVFGRVPVVLLTGAFDALDEAKASKAGYDGVLAKPFEPHAVIALVKKLLASAGTRDADGAKETGDRSDVAARSATTAAAVATPQPADDYFKRLDEVFGRSSEVHANSGTPDRHPAPAAPSPPLPAMADAFDWLLAEEVGAAATPPPFLNAALLDDAFIDAVAQRVVDRLRDPVVRDLVARDVLALAERLVREEIERLKGA